MTTKRIIAGVITIFAVLQLISGQSNLSTQFTCTNPTAPAQTSDCFTRTTNSGNYCCFLSGIQLQSSNKMCVSLPSVSYVGAKTYDYNGVVYNIDCGVGNISASILNPCGAVGAASKSDCSIGSSYVNSCCHYTGTDILASPCYWLGTKYWGNTVWAGMSLECSGSYLAFSLTIIFSFLIFIF